MSRRSRTSLRVRAHGGRLRAPIPTGAARAGDV